MTIIGQAWNNLNGWLKGKLRSYVLGPSLSQSHYWAGLGEPVTQREKLDYLESSSAIYTVNNRRAKLLARLPIKLYKLRNGKKIEVTSGVLRDLLYSVNPFWTFKRLIKMTEMSLGIWGKSFWFVERGPNGMGKPREIWWARSDRVQVVIHPEKYISGYLYYPPGFTPVGMPVVLSSFVDQALAAGAIPFMPSETIWFQYPHPRDEFLSLSPLVPLGVFADYEYEAMKSNINLHRNGLQIGGILTAKSGNVLSEEDAESLELSLERRFKGSDKAHRWGVLRIEADLKEIGFTPEDAQFIEGLDISLQRIANGYDMPPGLFRDDQTYENYRSAMLSAWEDAILPEADFIADQLIEVLLPMAPGEADLVEFDSSGVAILQEAQSAKWDRNKGKIEAGTKTINEVREEDGDDPVPWGDVWWAPANLLPVERGSLPASATPPVQPEPGPDERSRRGRTRAIDFDSPEHWRVWGRFAERTERLEQKLKRLVVELFERQQRAVIERLRQPARMVAGNGHFRSPEAATGEPFDMEAWIKEFRENVRPALLYIAEQAGLSWIGDEGLGISFDVMAPNVIEFLEERAQRFAVQVNETTWSMLQSSLGQGFVDGESIPDLEKRVVAVMAHRIRSSAEVIARTETIGVFNGGMLLTWQQSGLVSRKVWLATLDKRTRDSHEDAHGQTVDLDDDFDVGGGRGPAPGQIGIAREDIQCRCTMTAVLS